MALTKPQGDMMTKLGTMQASTSGTDIDFTGIPAGTTMIIISCDRVGLSGASTPLIQIGDSGGIEATGYTDAYHYGASTTTWSVGTITTGFASGTMGNADNLVNMTSILILMDPATNLWNCVHLSQGYSGTAVYGLNGSGVKALSGTLDRVRISGSPDNFDAGNINIAYF